MIFQVIKDALSDPGTSLRGVLLNTVAADETLAETPKQLRTAMKGTYRLLEHQIPERILQKKPQIGLCTAAASDHF